MARLYQGELVQLERARELWRPGVNRVRIPGLAEIEDFDEMFRLADKVGASDVTLQVGEPVWFEINNEWVPVTNKMLTTPEMERFLKKAYDAIGPGEVIQRGRPIDHAFIVLPRLDGDRKIRIRLNATGGRDPLSDSVMTSAGVQSSCRILPGAPPRLQERGVEQAIIDGFKLGPGIVFVTGPTGSGKTTLLGGAIRKIGEDPQNSAKIIEYSAPVELVYDDIEFNQRCFIHQLEVGRAIRLRPDDGGSSMLWAACVAIAMRRKPTIILIGEARDAATIEGCVVAATTGHGVMSTMHTVGVAETLRRAIMALAPDQRASVGIDLMQMSTM